MPVEDNKLGGKFGWERTENTIERDVWVEWLTPALERGIMRCKPEPEVVGQGLGVLQEACDLMGKGVSAKKLVVELGLREAERELE